MSTFKKIVDAAASRVAFEEVPAECQHAVTEVRSRTIRGGSVQYVRQCLDCGEPVGNPLKQMGQVPAFDEQLRETAYQRRQKNREAVKARESAEWWSGYHQYMASEAWAGLREKVLRRDGYICRGCLTARATEVHHLTYENFGSEFAFQLMALCKPCHERYHHEKDGDE